MLLIKLLFIANIQAQSTSSFDLNEYKLIEGTNRRLKIDYEEVMQNQLLELMKEYSNLMRDDLDFVFIKSNYNMNTNQKKLNKAKYLLKAIEYSNDMYEFLSKIKIESLLFWRYMAPLICVNFDMNFDAVLGKCVHDKNKDFSVFETFIVSNESNI